ncbi:MAG: DUF6036 family nucleotidyltransferase [Ilumatobacteraceae bacterium]
MNLNRDFQEFVELFVAHEVEFLVVGGYALAAHGHPRYTKDLDVWVWVGPENARRVLAAVEEFGFGGLGLTVEDFQATDSMIRLGNEPQRIDILTYASGLDFREAYGNRVYVTIGDVKVPFISPKDLRTNKLAAGRPRDIADVADLSNPE